MGCLIQSTRPEEMCDQQAAQPPPDSAFLKRRGKNESWPQRSKPEFYKNKKKEGKLDVFLKVCIISWSLLGFHILNADHTCSIGTHNGFLCVCLCVHACLCMQSNNYPCHYLIYLHNVNTTTPSRKWRTSRNPMQRIWCLRSNTGTVQHELTTVHQP